MVEEELEKKQSLVFISMGF